jgi:hypothetical protein
MQRHRTPAGLAALAFVVCFSGIASVIALER